MQGKRTNHVTTWKLMRSSNWRISKRIFPQKVGASSKRDLVFSPAQVTEHRRVELKDQEISKETRERFEKLKGKHPKVFSINSKDIGQTILVTMHVDTGDNPPICQKPYTLPLNHYSWVQQEIKTLERTGVIKKSISPWASPIVVVLNKSASGEAPRQRMFVDF